MRNTALQLPFVDELFAALAGPNVTSLALTPPGRTRVEAQLRAVRSAGKAQLDAHVAAAYAVIGHLDASGAASAARGVAELLRSVLAPAPPSSDRAYRQQIADTLGLGTAASRAPTLRSPPPLPRSAGARLTPSEALMISRPPRRRSAS